MKILSLKPAENEFLVQCHSLEDLEAVAGLIHAGDLVGGETDRNIKPRELGQKAFRQKMFLTVSAVRVEIDSSLPVLRVLGSIESGSPEEFVERRAMHTIEFHLKQKIRVKKNRLFRHEIDQLKQAESDSKKPWLLGIILDDEEALIVQVSNAGFKELGKINAFKSGKQLDGENRESKYFQKLLEIIRDSSLEKILIAGPGFTRENVLAFLRENLPGNSEKQLLTISTRETGQKGIREALTDKSLTNAFGEFKHAKEEELMQDVLLQLGKDSGLAAYGLNEVESAVKMGAVHTVLVTSVLLNEQKERVSSILETARQIGSRVFILETRFDPGKQLEGLGGIAALLRYRVE
jgi:protein pelota